MKTQRIVLVTGANRGLGLETCRQMALQGDHVFLGSRDIEKGQAAAKRLEGKVEVFQIDVAAPGMEERTFNFFEKNFGRLDVLVNNAGVLPGGLSNHGGSAFDVPMEEVRLALETNALSAFRLSQKVVPLMQKNGYGRVVNVSSGMGQLSAMGTGDVAYRLSKTAMNGVTAIFAAATKQSNIRINSISPGWVRTDMGGTNATRSVEEGVRVILWAANLDADGPTGGFFREGPTSIAW